MTSRLIHALLIEDDPDDVLLLKEALSDVGLGKIKLDNVDLLSRGLIQLGSESYDVLLLDLNLPDSRGLDTLNTTIKKFPRLPVVVLSGLADDLITIEAVRQGAQDYLVKGEINGPLVMRVMRYAIERKQVEAVLRQSEARYRTLVETSPNGITLADLEGKLLLCNVQAARLYGYSKPEAMLGINVFKLIAPGDRRLAVLNTQKTLNEGKITNASYTAVRRDGTPFPAEISSAVLRNNAGAPTGFISITRDITEQKKAMEAEKQLVMLEVEFMSSVSQGLRTPLTSLMEYLDLLIHRKSTGSLVRNEYLLHASQDAARILDMVDELSDFSLLESGRLVLDWGKADFSNLVAEVLTSMRDQANAKRVVLHSPPLEGPLLFDGDAARIRRVLARLVEYAIQSSNPGGSVLVTVKAMNDHLLINVIDEGEAISNDDASRIFDKYYQVSRDSNVGTLRLGTGLYLPKQIVEAHRGSLSLNSQMGSGNTYTISFPISRQLKPVPKPH